jgi:transcriptional regulator of nitric oxide reductase
VRGSAGPGQLDAVAGATVSSSVMADAVVTAARAVARHAGLIAGHGIDLDQFSPAAWDELVADGSLAKRKIDGAAAAALVAALGAVPALAISADATFAELFVGLASVGRIGRNLLGAQRFDGETARLDAGDLLLFVGGRGLYSFRGTAWRREGWLDRIQLAQDDRTWRLAAADHVPIEALAVDGAPELRELSLFVLRADSGFRPDRAWRLQLLVPGRTADGAEAAALAEVPYRLPARYLLDQASTMPLWDLGADLAVPLG